MSFTFAVQFNGRGRNYHYFGEPGTVEVGDAFVTPNLSICEVTDIDTNNPMANKYLVGQKVDPNMGEFRG